LPETDVAPAPTPPRFVTFDAIRKAKDESFPSRRANVLMWILMNYRGDRIDVNNLTEDQQRVMRECCLID
jgi:hypothetical protein